MNKIQFTILRDPKNKDLEYWVYEDVIGVTERGNYIVVRTVHSPAIIPKYWIKEVKEFKN